MDDVVANSTFTYQCKCIGAGGDLGDAVSRGQVEEVDKVGDVVDLIELWHGGEDHVLEDLTDDHDGFTVVSAEFDDFFLFEVELTHGGVVVVAGTFSSGRCMPR